MLSWLAKLLTGGALDRVLRTVDTKIANETDREKLRVDALRVYMETRPGFMRAGGFLLMLGFALPLMVWYGAVIVYSLLWCRLCVWPQDWTIAALPPPLDEWSWLIVVSIFGVVGFSSRR